MGYIGTRPTAAPLTSSQLDDGIVTAAKLATDAVETAKVKDVNVTAGKLAATQDLSTKTITLPATVAGLGTGLTNAQLQNNSMILDVVTRLRFRYSWPPLIQPKTLILGIIHSHRPLHD